MTPLDKGKARCRVLRADLTTRRWTDGKVPVPLEVGLPVVPPATLAKMANENGNDGEPTIRISDVDANVLIGLLAIVQGDVLTDELPLGTAEKIRERFVRERLLAKSATVTQDLAEALGRMIERLRAARGESGQSDER